MTETKKYVRIKKATCKSAWYADKIGQVFEVEREGPNYLTRTGPNHLSAIRKEDAEVIVTENRKAAIGERVLLTTPTNTKGKYRVGDLFTVRVSGETGVNVVEDEFMTLRHKEYEVIIENEEDDEMKNVKTRYDLAVENAREAIEELRLAAYEQGYEDAKRRIYTKDPAVSAQARRDEIVEQAKADAEELVMDNTSEWCGIDFIVNRNKRTVVALIKGEYTSEVFARGIAKAAPDDCFNVHIGKAVALRRALGLAVPDEYLNAPQPTEVRVGDVVCGNGGDDHYYSKNKTFTITKDSVERIDDGFLYKENAGDWIKRDQIGRIIDDSREEVGGE